MSGSKDLTRAQITTLRRAAGLLDDLGEEQLSHGINHYVDVVTGRAEALGKVPIERGDRVTLIKDGTTSTFTAIDVSGSDDEGIVVVSFT
jgi:hypothetical protein